MVWNLNCGNLSLIIDKQIKGQNRNIRNILVVWVSIFGQIYEASFMNDPHILTMNLKILLTYGYNFKNILIMFLDIFINWVDASLLFDWS